MGLWAWNVSQLLTPKFWRLVKKDGLLQTYVRGHKTRRAAHDVGGRLGPVKCVGMDNFGNKYYEDFDVDFRFNKRWVEFSDYFLDVNGYSDKVPPGWHGWLCGQYDDAPNEDGVYVEPHYKKEHTPNLSYTPEHYNPPGAPNPFNQKDSLQF